MSNIQQLAEAMKHLPGQHDQKSHGGGRGGADISTQIVDADGNPMVSARAYSYVVFDPSQVVKIVTKE